VQPPAAIAVTPDSPADVGLALQVSAQATTCRPTSGRGCGSSRGNRRDAREAGRTSVWFQASLAPSRLRCIAQEEEAEFVRGGDRGDARQAGRVAPAVVLHAPADNRAVRLESVAVICTRAIAATPIAQRDVTLAIAVGAQATTVPSDFSARP